jgi:RNA polymerase sigma-70 factor (ECF subfamily)
VQSRNVEPAAAAEFAAFMRRHQDTVYSTAARLLGNDAQAEDVAQEVFVRAYRDFEALRAHPAAVAWLRTVARNLCLNHIARYRRRWRLFSELRSDETDDEDDGGPEFAVADSVLEEVEGGDRRERLEEALRQLPEQQRVPLALFHFEDLSYAQISRQLGVSLAKLKTDMHRGRLALARALAGLEL